MARAAPDDSAAAAKMLAWALAQELPGIAFDEVVVEYLAEEWRTSENVAEAWSPFLISHNAVSDDDAALELANRILARLREAPDPERDGGGEAPAKSARANGSTAVAATPAAEEAEIAGLEAFLEQLALRQYSEKASAWCRQAGVSDVAGLLSRAEEFSQALELKPLERRRLHREHESRAAASAFGDAGGAAATAAACGGGSAASSAAGAGPAGSPAVAAAVRQALAEGHSTFGSKEDPYIVYESIGKGATARVYRCAKASDPTAEFAVKIIIRQSLSADAARAEEKLRRETEILFSLRHTNIVSLYEVWETREKLYLVMELVHGGDLFGVVSKSVLSEQDALYVFLQLVDALRYIHSKSVIHRDLKLENILVAPPRGNRSTTEDRKSSRSGWLTVKITDFGQSKLIDDDSMARTRTGTVQYWAPEVLDERMCAKGYDAKVDLWSLGVVLYVMLEGSYPFSGASMHTQVKTASFEFSAKSRCSPEARSLIRSLIQVKPSDRLALDACSRHPWVKNGQGPILQLMQESRERAPGDDDESRREERFTIQGDPDDVETLRRELWEFTTEFRFPAVLMKREVIVTWASEKGGNEDAAREKLIGILSRHFPGRFQPAPRRKPGRGGRADEPPHPAKEGGGRSRT